MKLEDVLHQWHGTLRSYAIGFTISLMLTILSFSLVATRVLDTTPLLFTIAALALIQAAVQVFFFLHLGKEASPRWETYAFWFMLLVLIVIVVGSLWIMHDLNNRVMVM